MRAALFERFRGPITVATVDEPAPTPGGVVIRVEATGICRSDWHGWVGHDADVRLPHVPGHEWAGTIAAVGGAVTGWQVGDRVTAPFVCGCGHCVQCDEGDPQVCANQFQPGFTAWGSFAEYVMIDYAGHNLVRLPEGLDSVTAASLGCRFATSFRAVAHQARVAEGHRVAVLGCGGVGLAAIMIARALGAEPIAVDLDADKLELARQVGATHTLDASRTKEVATAIQELTSGGAHAAIDALGSASTAHTATMCLRPRGRHVQVGLMTGSEARAPLPWDLVVARELEVYGSHGMQARCYPEMLELIADGRLDPGLLVGRRVSLREGIELLSSEDAFRRPGIAVIDRFD